MDCGRCDSAAEATCHVWDDMMVVVFNMDKMPDNANDSDSELED